MLERLHFETREEWLKGRGEIRGIGASEAAAAIGLSKWCSPIELWREKTGKAPPKDLSGVDYVELGTKTERPMRELFTVLHPEYKVEHFPFDILYQRHRPEYFATLDGELTDLATGDRGILEIKKFEIQKSSDWQEWKDKIPNYYFCQILHQFHATGFSFAWMFALLLKRDGDGELRQYYFPRELYEPDIDALIDEEEQFIGYVRSGRVPPTPLVLGV